MPIERLYQLFKQTNGVCTDTRKLKKNQMFVALKGPNFNGNEYAKLALENGAKYVMIDEEAHFQDKNNTILVPDCLNALQELANFHRKALNLKVLSITGSNGKTTTKELIYNVLSKKYEVLATEGNLNNHIGVPLTLLKLTEKHEIAIVEMGANHLKEIELLCKIAAPDYALITNIGLSHLGEFGSEENIKKGKLELFDHILENNGFAFINADDAKLLEQAKKFDFDQKLTYGSGPFADVVGYIENKKPFVEIICEGETIKSKLYGNYNYINILAAVAVGKKFELKIKDIKTAIENYTPTNNRSQMVENESNTIILDCYNANPSSMFEALKNINEQKDENKVLILAQMNELGTFSKAEHQKIVDLVNEMENVSSCFFVGKAFDLKMNENQYYFEKTEDLAQKLKTLNFKNALILIKGSRSSKLEDLLTVI